MSEKEIIVRDSTYKLVKMYVDKIERNENRSLSFDGVIYDLFANAMSHDPRNPRNIHIGSMEGKSLDEIKEVLIELFPNSDWKDSNYNDLVCFCFNKTWEYLKNQYPNQMYKILKKKLICPESWTKEERAKFLGIKLEGMKKLVKLEIEVSEKLAKFLNHPKLNDTFVVESSGKLIEEALEDALKSWTDDRNWGIESQLKEMGKKV